MSTDLMEDLYLFPGRLKEERDRLELSQAALGKLLGVDIKTIGKWERGETWPTARHLFSLREHGADMGYLLMGVRKPVAVSLAKAHGEHICRLVDTLVQQELDVADAAVLETLIRHLGRTAAT